MSGTQKKIIAALDFSEASLSACDLAASFAKNYESELVLLYVIEPQRGFFHEMSATDYENAQKKAAEKKLDSLTDKYNSDGVNASKMFTVGKPWKEIVRVGNEIFADMIFMGTAGISTIGEMFVGSNASRVTRTAECPVITVRNLNNKEVKKVMIPVDTEFGIREIRAFLRNYHKNFRPAIELLAIIGEKEEESAQLTDHMQKQKEELLKFGFPTVEIKIIKADIISSAIIGYGSRAENEIDLIMMETHGRSGLSGIFIGSITEEVLSYAEVPVLSLKPNRRESGTEYYSPNLPV